MSRPSAFPLRLLIPFFAALAVLSLSSLPWGWVKQTYLLLPSLAAKSTEKADISLSGMQWPRVGIAIVEYERGMYARVTLSEKETEESDETEETDEVTLMVPVSWELQEVSGVRAQDLMRDSQSGHHMISWTPNGEWRMENGELTLLFKTSESFETLRFVHDSPFPALFTVSHATFPEREMRHTTHFVKEMRVIEL